MFAFKSLLNMPRFEAIAVAFALVAAMGYTIISLEWLPHMSIVTAIVVLLLYGLMRGLKYQDMQNGMIGAVGQGMGAIYLFFLYRPDGQCTDDERCDSDADVLRFRIDFAYLFLFLGVCALLDHRHFHRQ